jgi:hypothetical protein
MLYATKQAMLNMLMEPMMKPEVQISMVPEYPSSSSSDLY